MSDVDREAIRERKGVCGGCGSPLRSVGRIDDDDRRGEVLECRRDRCGYVEHRLYGDRYYEFVDEKNDSPSSEDS